MTKSQQSPESEFRTGAVAPIARERVVFGLAALVFVRISSFVINSINPPTPRNDAKTCSLLYQRFDSFAIHGSFVVTVAGSKQSA